MADKHVMITGAKESFLVRVLMKKTKDAGIECIFVPWNVDDINASWEGTALVVLYMGDEEMPHENVLHFFNDKMEEEGSKMIVVGDRDDVRFCCDHVESDHIYTTFERPVDNEKYVKTVTDFLSRFVSGEFRKSILIVDDDPSYLSLVREWLKGTYKVSMASSGLQAIKWLGKNKADLILLDYEMPVTTGPQVLEMLRSDEETKSIPVIFLTGKSDKNSVMAVVALRPEGYFLKTIGREELLEKLRDFFVLHKQDVT